MVLGDSAFLPLEGWKPVNPKRTALVIIDMQYATGSRNHGIAKIWEEQGHKELIEYRFGRLEKLVVPNVQRLLRLFRENGLKVLFVTYGSETADYSDLPFRTKRIAIPTNNRRGCQEHEILEDVKPLDGEVVINKTTVDAFTSSGIDTILRAWGIEFLVFVGVSTHACVDSTARSAADREYKCILIDDATAGVSQLFQEATIQNFGSVFGRVDYTDSIISEISNQLNN
ncbi:MAG TPA: cysteine hydrolase [Dehalococcoidia bacterium]|nr:cysteine hydrolase [Dehalococcoidia bacterium]